MHAVSLKATALAVAGLFVAGASVPAAAQSKWPDHTVNVIIPWAAGGGTDPLARIIFGDMSERLGQAFPMDFRPGGAGTIGATAVANGTPDGYTILFTSASPSVNANFMPNIAYNPRTDLVPIAQVTVAPSMVVANANVPYNTFQEMIDYAKKNPGKVNAAHGGVGGNAHYSLVTVQHKTGTKFNEVPYTGAATQQVDLLSGVVDIGVGFATGFLPSVKAGKLKFIAALSPERDINVPDVPASDESSYKGVHRANWFMAFAPKGTPRNIVDQINAEIRVSLAKPEVRKKIENLGLTVKTGSADDAAALVKHDTDEMKQMVDAGVFKIE